MRPVLAGLMLLSHCSVLLAATPPAEPLEQRLQRAWQALRSGDAAAAAPDLVAATRELPHAPGVLLAAAEALARTGKHAEAAPLVERAAGMGGVGDPKRVEEAFSSAMETPGLRPAIEKLKANATPLSRGAVALTLEEKDLIPESVAYDQKARAFYVGSLHKRKIVRVGADAAARDFVPQAASGLWAVLGMKIEPRRRELWVNSCNPVEASPPMVPEDPDTVGQAGVFRFDLRTGRLVRKHLAGSKEAPVCFNDLVITLDGAAWLSAGPDGIWRVRPDADAPERFMEYAGFVNGIAASDDGARIFLADHLRGVQVLEPATRSVKPLTLPATATLSGIDGLYVRGRTLVAVQNGLFGTERVIEAELDPALSSVTCHVVLDRNRPEFNIPTTGVLVDSDIYYVASSQLRSFDGKTPWPLDLLTKSTIIRTRLAGPGCSLAA